jgi:hypothetical protein
VIDGDWLERVAEDVFFSPTFEMRGHDINRSNRYIAREAQLLGKSGEMRLAGIEPATSRSGGARSIP